MKVKYETTIKVVAVYDFEGLKELKDNNEYAHDLAHFICDEVTQAGGVAKYEILESAIDVK